MAETILAPCTARRAEVLDLADDAPAESSPPKSRMKAAVTGLVAVVGFVAAGIAVWETVEYRFVAKRFGVVIPGGVYRSGQLSEQMFEPTIREHDLRAVIDLNGVENDDADQANEIASYERLGLEHHRFPLLGNGTGDLTTYIDAVEKLAELHKQGKPTLVHCHAGTQRTGSVVATFRVLVLGESPESACEELKSYGWDPVDDRVLLDYLNDNMPEVASQLVRRGVIPRVPNPLPFLKP